MIIGVPREVHRHEHRVGLSPFGVARLTQQGHSVVVEKEAGSSAHFADRVFERMGAQIVYSSEEAYKRADVVCRVGALAAEDIELLKPGSTICAFHHLAVKPREDVERLMELGVTLIGYEIIRSGSGELPVLHPFSEMAGEMSVHIAANLLQNESGGRGILLGNVAGVPPATVLVLGAGQVGKEATRQALASGAHVIVIDHDISKLSTLHQMFDGRAVTVVAGLERLEQYTQIADVVIGAILIPGGRAPFLISEEMVKAMKPGSVIIDVAIDQGGCVETSRPMELDNPTFVLHDVVHYCVGNMTANLARTASRALANVVLPYLTRIAQEGVDGALRSDAGLAKGVYMYQGRIVNEIAGETLGMGSTPLDEVMEGGRG